MMDQSGVEKAFLGVAHALFINRLHVLRLTEVVRMQISPNSEDGNLDLPPTIDDELKQQAVDFVLTCMPPDFRGLIKQAKYEWLNPA